MPKFDHYWQLGENCEIEIEGPETWQLGWGIATRGSVRRLAGQLQRRFLSELIRAFPNSIRRDSLLTMLWKSTEKAYLNRLANLKRDLEKNLGFHAIERGEPDGYRLSVTPIEELRKKPELPARQHPSSSEVVHWVVPFHSNPKFTGRIGYLHDIEALSRRDRNDSNVALIGPAGIGKTEIAARVAHEARRWCRSVFWVEAGSDAALDESLQRIALATGATAGVLSTELLRASVKNWLQQNQRWMVIVNNADDPSVLEPTFIPDQIKGTVLITSRDRGITEIVSPCKAIEVRPFTPEEGTNFILARTDRDDSVGEEELAAVSGICSLLGSLPLALQQAATYIAETGTDFRRYLAALKKRPVKALELAKATQYPLTAVTTWRMSVESGCSNPASRDLLLLSAFLNPDGIPEEIILEGAQLLGQNLGKAIGLSRSDPLAIDEVLSPLVRFSLVGRLKEQRYTMHRVLQYAVLHEMEPRIRRKWASRLHLLFRTLMKDSDSIPLLTGQARLANAMHFGESAETWGIITPELADLYEKAGYYAHYHLFDLRLAERLYRKCISICDSLQMNPNQCLSTRRSLGLLLQFDSRVKEGEALLARALDTAETDGGALELANSLNDIGLFYRHQHRYREAESCLTRTIAIRQKELGDQHPETAKARQDLALLYDDEGRFTEAEPLYDAAAQIFLERFGSSHIYSATVLQNYAKHWYKRNQLGSAEQFYRDAVSGFESSVGKDNPRTMVALQGLALIYEKVGNLQAAEAALARVFATRLRMFGREHELTARAERALSQVRQKQAKH